jgi:hypothetical protein
MKYQVFEITDPKGQISPEPDTYYGTEENARNALKRIETDYPALAGKLEVLTIKWLIDV